MTTLCSGVRAQGSEEALLVKNRRPPSWLLRSPQLLLAPAFIRKGLGKKEK